MMRAVFWGLPRATGCPSGCLAAAGLVADCLEIFPQDLTGKASPGLGPNSTPVANESERSLAIASPGYCVTPRFTERRIVRQRPEAPRVARGSPQKQLALSSQPARVDNIRTRDDLLADPPVTPVLPVRKSRRS